MNTNSKNLLALCFVSSLLISCEQGDFGANPYDPDTPVTVSKWPKVISFQPEKGKAGDEITITGKNFDSAVKVTFGGRDAASFTIVNDETIKAVLSPYGNSGAVAVTNQMGERSKTGFVYQWPEVPTENPNLALKGTATATEAFSGFFATSVNDGQKSAWVSSNNNPGEERWVMIELEKLSEINTVITYWDPNAAGTDFTLEVSEDGVDFDVVTEVKGWVSNGPDNGRKVIRFEPVSAKFVKLNNLYNSITPYNMTLQEFEIYNTPPAVNVAEKKPVEADCEFSKGSMFHITDGKLANMWQCDKTHQEHYVIVDLGDPETIDNIIISWDGGAYAKNAEIKVSKAGDEYVSVYSVADWNPVAEPREPGEAVWTKVVMNAEFEEQEVRYIRIDFNGDSGPWGITIYELEAYNQW